MSTARDGWLLATGTLTVLRVPPPSVVDRRVAGTAMVLAPLAVLPLAALAALVGLVGDLVDLPPLATAYVVLLALALGTRALHWDGLADTADGLTASYTPARSLEVMRTGPVGPAGVVAVVLVAGLQAAVLVPIARHEHGWLAVGLLVCASRVCLPLACLRGVPAARPDGLGAVHIGSVPALAAVASLLVGLLATGAAGVLLGSVDHDPCRPRADGRRAGRAAPALRTPTGRDHGRRPRRGGRDLLHRAAARRGHRLTRSGHP